MGVNKLHRYALRPVLPLHCQPAISPVPSSSTRNPAQETEARAETVHVSGHSNAACDKSNVPNLPENTRQLQQVHKLHASWTDTSPL